MTCEGSKRVKIKPFDPKAKISRPMVAGDMFPSECESNVPKGRCSRRKPIGRA